MAEGEQQWFKMVPGGLTVAGHAASAAASPSGLESTGMRLVASRMPAATPPVPDIISSCDASGTARSAVVSTELRRTWPQH